MEPRLPRRGREEETARLAPVPEAIPAFEAFADGLEFLSPGERSRLKLAGGEVLDNIIRHSSPMERRRIAVRAARRGGKPFLLFFFRSSPGTAFADFAQGFPGSAPLFDPARRRWRGMGLLMCRNLAQAVSVRHGSRMDRIILAFAPDA